MQSIWHRDSICQQHDSSKISHSVWAPEEVHIDQNIKYDNKDEVNHPDNLSNYIVVNIKWKDTWHMDGGSCICLILSSCCGQKEDMEEEKVGGTSVLNKQDIYTKCWYSW